MSGSSKLSSKMIGDWFSSMSGSRACNRLESCRRWPRLPVVNLCRVVIRELVLPGVDPPVEERGVEERGGASRNIGRLRFVAFLRAELVASSEVGLFGILRHVRVYYSSEVHTIRKLLRLDIATGISCELIR